ACTTLLVWILKALIDVVQNPMLWEVEGVDATMNCTHTKGAQFFQMYWYRQLPGETMKQIVYTSTASADHDFGNFSKDKFSATKPDAASGTLTVKKLQQGDKGWYFCAVSEHSDAGALDG
uniref:Ig-like domain-containing protein n=1 Tax=Gasterosteus aculeatus aculeatus TaxID=481459 RepID=A0AAQ4RQ54_GASAC